MKSKTKQQVLIGVIGALLLLSFIGAFSTLFQQAQVSRDTSDDRPEAVIIFGDLKTSGYWELTEVISIDDNAEGVGAQNWTWAVGQDWASGAGTSEDPYLIENVSITVDDANPGLTIANTSAYFKINNVTITNANAEGHGLYIIDSGNGTIINSDFLSNGATGLYLDNVVSTTITSVNSSLNTQGLYMANCTSNVITSSYFSNNTGDGINVIDSDLNNFTIEASGNGGDGMNLVDSDNCTIIDSQFISNTETGLSLYEDDGDTLDNTIYDNYFEDNALNAEDNSTEANNWDNGVDTGNEWDDYSGVDANDDGVGDTAYSISGTAGAEDAYPIFSDGTDVIISLGGGDDDDDDDGGKKLSVEQVAGQSFVMFTAGLLIVLFYAKRYVAKKLGM